jgi:4-amino-4-deoxy-L-arabinose transferase-like glycosyltransferase
VSNERLARRAIGAILLTFVLLALAYSVVNPLHEATDELRHYRFVRHVAELRALPVQGALDCSAQGHHPPLYYVLAALATGWVETGHAICHEPPRNPFWAYRYWEVGNDNKNQYLHGADEAFPWRGAALAAHLARAVNVAVGAAVVWLTYLIGRAIWPQRPFLALGATAFVAFNPMFLYMAGAINNDVIAAFSGAAVTLACVRLLRDENGLSRRWGLILGLLYGMALLSKFNLAAIALGVELSVTWVAWRRRQWRLWLEVNLLIALLTALLAGWWFVRNQLLYGEPTGFERVTELWGRREPAESFGVALWELPYAWTSLWGRFGYGQIPLPQPIYDGLWQLTVVGLSGLLLPLARRKMAEWRAVRVPLALLVVNVVTFFAVLFNYLLVSPAGPMGRFFFPALPALALLIFYGLAAWFLAVRDGLRKVRRVPAGRPTAGHLAAFSLATNLGMLLLALVALCGYLRPAFARPPTFDPDTAVPNPLDAQFDSLVRLRGYALSTDQLRPGEPLDVTLYWEVTGKPPGDFLFFLHLVDAAAGTMVAQRDTHPGLGNFPSSAWEPGDRFVETVRLYLPETAYTRRRPRRRGRSQHRLLRPRGGLPAGHYRRRRPWPGRRAAPRPAGAGAPPRPGRPGEPARPEFQQRRAAGGLRLQRPRAGRRRGADGDADLGGAARRATRLPHCAQRAGRDGRGGRRVNGRPHAPHHRLAGRPALRHRPRAAARRPAAGRVRNSRRLNRRGKRYGAKYCRRRWALDRQSVKIGQYSHPVTTNPSGQSLSSYRIRP